MAITLGGERQQATINVTPLIDLLLVLLIIFMAIAPVKQTGLDAGIPRNMNPAHVREAESPVVIEIALNGTYSLNSQAVDAGALGVRLTEVFARRAQRILWLKADGGLEFQSVAAVLDTARGVNIDRVALLPGTRN